MTKTQFDNLQVGDTVENQYGQQSKVTKVYRSRANNTVPATVDFVQLSDGRNIKPTDNLNLINIAELV